MAVTQQNSYRKFFGTAAERATFDEVLLGDKFFETDTGLVKVWDGAAFVADAEDVLSLAAGTAIVGKVGIDQVTASANQVVTKTGSVTTATLAAGTAIAGQFGIDQTTDGTTNKVQARNATHDSFNANANMQVGDADVANGNPVPVSDAGGSLTVDGGVTAAIDQTTDGTTNKVQSHLNVSNAAVTAANPVPVEGNTKSVYKTTELATSGVVKASPGTLYGIVGINDSATAQYIQLHDATAVPADTAIPVVVITVPTKSNFSIDFGMYGMAFATGICWSNSSTLATKTIGAADCWLTAIYK